MRRRLTISIVVLVLVTLVVTSIGSFYFIRRAAVSTGQQQLSGQAQAISKTITSGTIDRKTFARQLEIISDAGAFSGIAVVQLHADGSIVGRLPPHVTATMLDVPALEAGRQVTGHTFRLLVYSAVPTPIPKVTRYVPLLVITRQVQSPVNGLRYFLLVAAMALAIAALLAAVLSRRFTRPVTDAVAATRRIASGDLDATVPVRPREDAEFAQLAESINAMGANLVRARDQERQFILSVSHELRTPLTSIRGYADAIVDGAADDPTTAAAVITSEARRLERLVQDLLDLARLDADRFSLNVTSVDCAAVVRQVAEGGQPGAGEAGLELVVAVETEEPLWVQADADRLGQVMANLVENAASFAEHQIVVGAGLVSGAGGPAPDRPAAWVIDDGPGIPADQLAQVFERHFISDRVSGRRKGSGLGLAIVAELAAAMGAVVRAESPVAEGHGTRMVVWFPPDTAAP